MSQFYYGAQHSTLNPYISHAPINNAQTHHNHHGSRSRRSTRYSTNSQSGHHNHHAGNKSNNYFRNHAKGNQKEPAEAAQQAAWRKDFEAARSFDLDDDELFCPWHLLTEDDLHSITSSSSDRSSLSSGSPESSPLPHQLQPTSNFTMPALQSHPQFNNQYAMHSQHQQQIGNSHLKIHQPLAQRTRNAIPIVNPNSRNTSPPSSMSSAKTFAIRQQ